MAEEEGLVCAYDFDGKGGARELGWDAIDAPPPDGTFRWVHLQLTGARTAAWVRERSGVSELAAEALLAEETRPRCVVMDDGFLINLRGVNLNPGADPEDMVSLRFFVNARLAITVRRRRLMAVQDVRDALARGRGPSGPGDLVVALADLLVSRMASAVADLDDRVDQLEDDVLVAESVALRAQLRDLRRVAISLRRYISPQREAMNRLTSEPAPWLEQQHRLRLREIADRVIRYVEDLDATRERAAVVQDELASRLSEQMNRNTYVLTVVAGVFLPLSLLTGLLGINVGGIPGAETGWAFGAVTVALVVLGVIEILYLRRRRWL